jgi:hypothetical protein
MKKPRLYLTEGVLIGFVKKSSAGELIQYIQSLNKYIDWLERKANIEEEEEDVPLGLHTEDENFKEI